jgi:hypothetical protein
MNSLFCGRYDYKFNHLVFFTYLTGSFTSVTGASNSKQGTLKNSEGVKFLPWICVSSFILYSLPPQLDAIVNHKKTAYRGWRYVNWLICFNANFNAFCGLFRSEASIIQHSADSSHGGC